MPRIKLRERIRLLRIANSAISKCNRPKNAKKIHWLKQNVRQLNIHFMSENEELTHEILTYSLMGGGNDEALIDECYDNINLPLMIADKVQMNGRKKK